MTNDQLDELERLAKAAFDLGEIVATQDEPAWYDEQAATMGGRLPPEDAAFIAAANPAAVLELIAAARPGWQPIETHDGGRGAVLVWCAERRNTYTAIWRDDEWRGDPGWFHFAGLADRLRETPTHWMPLPAAPDAISAAEQVGMSDSECTKTPPPNAGEGLRPDIVAMFKDRGIEDIDEIDPEHDDWSLEEHLLLRAAQALRSNSPEAG